MKTVINKLGVNSTADEHVSLTVEGEIFIHETNVLKELQALQKNLAEISEIKSTLETLRLLIETIVAKEAPLPPTKEPEQTNDVKKPASKAKK